MTAHAWQPQPYFYVAEHKVTGHRWSSNNGKTMFRRPRDVKSAWRQAAIKGKAQNAVGNAVGIQPKKVLIPTNIKSKKPIRYIWPEFDNQDVYELREYPIPEVRKLQECIRMLREAKDHVPWQMKDEIVKVLSSDWVAPDSGMRRIQ